MGAGAENPSGSRGTSSGEGKGHEEIDQFIAGSAGSLYKLTGSKSSVDAALRTIKKVELQDHLKAHETKDDKKADRTPASALAVDVKRYGSGIDEIKIAKTGGDKKGEELSSKDPDFVKRDERAYFADAALFVKSERLASGKPIEIADDSLIFRTLITTATGKPETWGLFIKDYRQAAAKEGKLKTGAEIENFQREWAKTHCARKDIYADIAKLKADLGTETRIVLGRSLEKSDPGKALGRLGYEVGYAFGFDGVKLSGQEMAKIYDVKELPAGFGGKGSNIVFDPESKAISFKGAGDKVFATVFPGIEREKDEYIAQLKREKGIIA